MSKPKKRGLQIFYIIEDNIVNSHVEDNKVMENKKIKKRAY